MPSAPSSEEVCESRSRSARKPMFHLFTSHERITARDGAVVADRDVCSWCGKPAPPDASPPVPRA